MLPNVTIAQTSVLSALDYTRAARHDRDDGARLSVRALRVRRARDAPWRAHRRRAERRRRSRSTRSGCIDAIDERTRLVAISHVLFRSAFIMDAEAICRRAREVGALVSLDAFHSVGVIPVDVKALGVDFLSGGV